MKAGLRGFLLAALGVAMLVSAGRALAAEKYFVIASEEDDLNELMKNLTSGNGIATIEKKDVFPEDKGKASLKVTGDQGDSQRFNPSIPGWAFKIVDKPDKNSDTEYRYITWAWKKVGGKGIQLQLSGQGDWGHRYHAGVNEKAWNPSLEVAKEMPKEWTAVTADIFGDWKGFTLTGIALSSTSADYGLWDHIVLHQTPKDPLALLAVEPKGKLATVWAEVKTGR